MPVALGLVAILNLGIGLFVPAAGRGIWAKADSSLTHLVHTDQNTVDRRYGFYMELGDSAGGSILFVPPGSPVDPDVAAGLSGVEVVEDQYDAGEIPSTAQPAGEPIGQFSTNEGDVPYWVLEGGESEAYWWLGRTAEGFVVIPESAAPRPSR